MNTSWTPIKTAISLAVCGAALACAPSFAQTAAKPAAKPAPKPAPAAAKPWDKPDEPSNEPEAGEAQPATDDVSVAPPSGPLALYRVRLDGAFTDRPTLLVKIVDGAAVWVPASR